MDALFHLQSINVAHCDIKPENILISSVEPLQIKICDVGSSKHLTGSLTQTGLLTGVLFLDHIDYFVYVSRDAKGHLRG
jgi:serine/threonine protein kinase